MKSVVVAAGVTLVALLVASCGSEPGEAMPAPAPSSSGGSVVDSKAPKVARPLDATEFVGDPCRTLTPGQQQELDIEAPGRARPMNEGADGCSWDVGQQGRVNIGVTFQPSIKNGLGNVYALDEAGHWAQGYFEPTEVAGYPGAYASLVDKRPEGGCSLAVATSDTLTFLVVIQGRAGDPGCKAAENVASAVLETVRAG